MSVLVDAQAAMDPLEWIIWSADVGTLAELMMHLRRMSRLRYVKIDRLFAERNGLSVIGLLEEMGIHVFFDGKIIEVPTKAELLAKLQLKQKPFMLNCMAGICSTGILESPDNPELIDGLKMFADACHAAGTRPCGVTVLTSKTPQTVAREFHRQLNPGYEDQVCTDQVLEYVEMLLHFGFTDVVCSPREIEAIRSESRFDFLSLNTPGIRPVGSAANDQARADTPSAAIKAGATRLIIGRPIHAKGDPAENLANIIAEVEQTLAERAA